MKLTLTKFDADAAHFSARVPVAVSPPEPAAGANEYRRPAAVFVSYRVHAEDWREMGRPVDVDVVLDPES